MSDKVWSVNGATDRERSCNIYITSVALYQLSYSGIILVPEEGFEPSRPLQPDASKAPAYTVPPLWHKLLRRLHIPGKRFLHTPYKGSTS